MKTTPKHFAAFKAACRRWQDRLSLGDWELRFLHEDRDGSLAEVHRDADNKLASLALADEWGPEPVTPGAIEYAARHEMLHVLLADLEDLARSRVCTNDMWAAAEHAVIRRLERVLK